MKRTLGIILLTSMLSTPAMAGSTSSSDQAPKVERKVVRVVVKEKKVTANYLKTDTKHIKRAYGTQNSAAKVFKPTSNSAGMPNLFKN